MIMVQQHAVTNVLRLQREGTYLQQLSKFRHKTAYTMLIIPILLNTSNTIKCVLLKHYSEHLQF